jgi:hypothetical protein
MDRVAPRTRPQGRNAGSQRWSDLLFVHATVPAEQLRPLVPEPLELDLWEGKALVGFVPFKMENIVPPVVPPALGLNFLETNLRTYVHHAGKPGVFFLSLEASSLVAVEVAKTFWGLPYFHADMSFEGRDSLVTYESRRRHQHTHFRAKARFREPLPTPEAPSATTPLTLEYFLLERYLLFVARRGELHCGAVHHLPYPLRAVELLEFSEELTAAVGLSGVSPPICAHASPGVSVEVFSTFPVAKLPLQR